MDAVFKALADPSRRRLLDSLNARNGQSLRELCADLDMTRQAVAKHLAVLEDAGLVASVRRGREKLHYLNAAPIGEIAERWIGRYDRARVAALTDLKKALEDETPMDAPEFVYVTYIRTTPEKLWRALTEPEFTRRYWGGTALKSDWKPGSPLLWQMAPGEEYRDLGQVVLEADPHRRLSYTWHGFQPEHRELFGWSEERFAELLKERRSKVTFAIEPVRDGELVKLTVIHDGFEPGSEMYRAISGASEVSGGWPELLSDLKTFLETGEVAGEVAGAAH
ncbi:DNA-binding transcriptional ArsR family regulator [Thermocatellispora tengchongensis]|uniref:DNA-binding transcriptional ArsR family regulator n=1 Tax=Thermocatellispora tengchongensis TaxID=1073253 RepID=A0A840PGW4_9ACTN|nr:metalloregulator ArsR/SmtB family transcription factor [Thermocatellispora tengchongensis]MBB5136377.1 DNA-binding transcriptional ArsR family regulator [Thermocatellispora tengchongensis]